MYVFGHGVGNRSGAGHGGQSLPVITVIKRVKGIKPVTFCVQIL